MGNTKTKLMNFRNTTLALTLAATSSAIKLNSSNVFDDIGDAFDDAYDWTKVAVNDAGEWMEGATNDAYAWTVDAADDAYDWTVDAADDIANFAKDNQDALIGTGAALATGGGSILIGLAADQAGLIGGDDLDLDYMSDFEWGWDITGEVEDIAEIAGEGVAESTAELSAEELLEIALLAAAA